MEAAIGGRGRLTPPVCHVVSGARRPGCTIADAGSATPIRPVRSAHMRKITLPSGTMLASNASNHVRAAHLWAIPTSKPATTKPMKTSPCAVPNTLTPISVRGVPRYLKYMPTSRPAQLTASAKAINRNQPTADRRSNAGVMTPLCRRNTPATTSRRRELAGAQDQSVALPAGTAQCGHRVAGTASCQFKGRVQGDPGPRHADRMADRDGPAVDVDLRRIDPEFLRRRQRDRRERLVDLDDVELVDGDAFTGDGLLDGVRG